jgi:tetratricopeptide (TPR) repeat protein
LIDALMRLQQWSQTESQIKRAYGCKDADVIDLKVKMGTVQMRLGRFDSAAAVLREAVAAQPDNATAQLNLGAALLQLSNLGEAEAALVRAYELKGPNAAGAQLLLGQLYFKKGDHPKAIQAFEIYLKEMPNAPNAAKVRESIEKLRQSAKKE